MLLVLTVLAAFVGRAAGECANACNGHGKCTSYDMCICNRNWQANDCSERVCQFGLAHVDSPKGDLDMSGEVTGPNTPVIDNHFQYPYGTTEQFPQMEDSDLNPLTHSAHYYMECSNKGVCQRSTGECQCYEGYDGVACQRASCPGYPNSCSGHGVCKTIAQLAAADHGNVYKLWDKDSTMGCQCDPGYYGPDCSLRDCKHGVDPLYLDDAATVKYPTWDLATLTDASNKNFTDGQSVQLEGFWAIRFYDSFGEDWLTSPISANAYCDEVVNALESLPNNVIPKYSVQCTRLSVNDREEGEMTVLDAQSVGTKHVETIYYKMAFWEWHQPANEGEVGAHTATIDQYVNSDTPSTIDISGTVYRLKFFGNPGRLREPEIELYLDGKRPSLVKTGNKVLTKVWTDGQQGEDVDHFADHCDGVTVSIASTKTNGLATAASYLTGFTTAERNLLKACLGDSDFDTSNNQDVYNWDKGNKFYPHLVKLVRTVTTYTDGGYYAALYFDTTQSLDNLGTGGTFILLNPFTPADASADTDVYDVYTTKGTLALTSNRSQALFGYGSRYIYTANFSYDTNLQVSNSYDGDISCELGNNNAEKFQNIFHCLNKTDLFTMLNFERPQDNPPYINLYTAERLHTINYQHNVRDRFETGSQFLASVDGYNEMHFMTHVVTTDLNTNWGASLGDYTGNRIATNTPIFHVYKFFPDTRSNYNYVASCSNRGICDTSSGLCKCFPGYTADNCGEQISVNC